MPDPNRFGGAVQIFRAGAEDWAPVAEAGGYRGATRGYGVSDLVSALTTGTAHRANGEVAYHVLDMMEGLRGSRLRSRRRRHEQLRPSAGRLLRRAPGRPQD